MKYGLPKLFIVNLKWNMNSCLSRITIIINDVKILDDMVLIQKLNVVKLALEDVNNHIRIMY